MPNILTDEQINQIQDETGAAIWGGAMVAAIQAAARMGMLRAAEIAKKEPLMQFGDAHATAEWARDRLFHAIRAAAEASPDREG